MENQRIVLSSNEFKRYLKSVGSQKRVDILHDLNLAENKNSEFCKIILNEDGDEYFIEVTNMNKSIIQSFFKPKYGKTLIVN